MKVDGKDMRTIWKDKNSETVSIIDQRWLPHEVLIVKLKTVNDAITAIQNMSVRGAPLIGVTGAYGVYLACVNAPDADISDKYIRDEGTKIRGARPTAVNLAWGVDRAVKIVLNEKDSSKRKEAALQEAGIIAEEEVENCRLIGEHGLGIVKDISERKQGKTVNILTHCNAGWLACVEWGTATAPMYAAFNSGIDIHIWVDETRPLNQGARLTAWELGKYGIKHTVITDNAGGHLMQHGLVDMVIAGTDRATHTGDAANKIGTYLKALAAKDNNIPFYVALPSSTFDWKMKDGVKEIPIEERDPDEIRYIQGRDKNGETAQVLVPPKNSPAANHAFDVTPARLITGFITERGICEASEKGVRGLFPEKG